MYSLLIHIVVINVYENTYNVVFYTFIKQCLYHSGQKMNTNMLCQNDIGYCVALVACGSNISQTALVCFPYSVLDTHVGDLTKSFYDKNKSVLFKKSRIQFKSTNLGNEQTVSTCTMTVQEIEMNQGKTSVVTLLQL